VFLLLSCFLFADCSSSLGLVDEICLWFGSKHVIKAREQRLKSGIPSSGEGYVHGGHLLQFGDEYKW
jgi:hypothetical protein